MAWQSTVTKAPLFTRFFLKLKFVFFFFFFVMKIIKAEQKDFNEINCLAEKEFPYTKKNLDKIELRIKKGNFIFVAKDQKTF